MHNTFSKLDKVVNIFYFLLDVIYCYLSFLSGMNWGRFKDFRLETKKLIMQNLVKEVNPFFVEDICGPGCNCPKKISA